MSYVIAVPELMAAAAADLTRVGSDLSAAHAAAAPTTAVAPAAADEVSAGVAHLFSHYGAGFQGLTGHAAAFHDQFVGTLKSGAGSYASAEAVSAALLRPLASSIPSLLPPSVHDWVQKQVGHLMIALLGILLLGFFVIGIALTLVEQLITKILGHGVNL